MTVAEVIADHQLLQGRNEDYRGRIISEAWVCACGTRFKHSGQEGYKEWAAHVAGAIRTELGDDLGWEDAWDEGYDAGRSEAQRGHIVRDNPYRTA